MIVDTLKVASSALPIWTKFSSKIKTFPFIVPTIIMALFDYKDAMSSFTWTVFTVSSLLESYITRLLFVVPTISSFWKLEMLVSEILLSFLLDKKILTRKQALGQSTKS